MPAPLHLTHCTLTGVDERTDLDKVAELSHAYPVAEWGVLYSPKQQGKPGRYPSAEFIAGAFWQLPQHVRVALHVCGQGVDDLLREEKVVSKLVAMVGIRGGRIQLNFNAARDGVSVSALHDLLNRLPSLTVITQHNCANENLWQELGRHPNHAILFDSSGGRGVLPTKWPAMLPVPCGYAGGLGPANLDRALDALAQVTGSRPFWTDMETNIRTMDWERRTWLDLELAEACLKVAQARSTRD